MISRPGSALRSVVVLPLVEGYSHLSAREVMADLPYLARNDLRLVLSLEEMAGRRPEICERIAGLLDSPDDRAERAEPSPSGMAESCGDAVLPAVPPTGESSVVDIAPYGRRLRPRRWRRRRTRLIVSMVATVVVTAGPLVVYAHDRASTRAVVRTAASVTTPTMSPLVGPVGPTDVALDPLEQLLIGAPPGYTQQADATSNSGPRDLTKAATDDAAPGALSTLTRDGFAHGYQRTWLSADQSQITVLVYQFKDAGGAAAYARAMVSKARSGPGFVADFAVSGIPGAVGQTVAGTGDVTATVVVTKGSHLVRVALNASSDTGLAVTAQELARAQYRRL